MNIADKLRASHVKRWHIVATSQTQTLADHQWCVTQIACDISWRMGLEPTKALMARAMSHDNDEIFEGDVPSPVKPSKSIEDMETIELIIKAADLIEQWRFIREFGVGSHADEVREYCADCLSSFLLDCPQDAIRMIVRQVVKDLE